MATTWTLTEEEVEEFDLPYSLIDEEIFDESRWGTWKRGVFEHDGKFWQVEWEDVEQVGPWENEDCVATLVEKREVVVTKWVEV